VLFCRVLILLQMCLVLLCLPGVDFASMTSISLTTRIHLTSVLFLLLSLSTRTAMWQVAHLDRHPLFERVSDAELVDDVCVDCMTNGTHEARKVSRLNTSNLPRKYTLLTFNAYSLLSSSRSLSLSLSHVLGVSSGRI
jgi:hypothetical protein